MREAPCVRRAAYLRMAVRYGAWRHLRTQRRGRFLAGGRQCAAFSFPTIQFAGEPRLRRAVFLRPPPREHAAYGDQRAKNTDSGTGHLIPLAFVADMNGIDRCKFFRMRIFDAADFHSDRSDGREFPLRGHTKSMFHATRKAGFAWHLWPT